MAVEARSEGNDMLVDEEAKREWDDPFAGDKVIHQAERKQEHTQAAVPARLEDGDLFASTWESLPDVFPIHNEHFEWSVDDDLKSLAGQSDGDSHSEMDDDFDLGLDLTSAEAEGDDGLCSAPFKQSKDTWSWEKGGGEDKPPTTLSEMFSSRSPLKPKVRTRRPPRSIINVERSTRLEWNDISRLPEKWPWSMHRGLTNMSDEDDLVNRISEVDKWALANETDGVRQTVQALEDAGFDHVDCLWREIMIAWSNSVGALFLPVAINDIGKRMIEEYGKAAVNRITDEERCIARWRALPAPFHFDQLNLCNFVQRLGGNTQRACLQLGGLLSFEEAMVVSKLIEYTACQSGSVVLSHDLETAYIQCWRYLASAHSEIKLVQDVPVILELPFPPSPNWRRTDNKWCILHDEAVDRTGALDRWCAHKWGKDVVGNYDELVNVPTTHLTAYDKTLFWTLRAWRIIWRGTLDYLPPIACDLLLSIVGPPLLLEERTSRPWRRSSSPGESCQGGIMMIN